MSYLTISSIAFLPCIIFLGVITSFEDYRYGLIKNKWILLSLLYCAVVYVIFYFVFLFSESNNIYYFYFQFFDRWCLNLCISAIVGFALWKTKVWAAGDAKLFITFCALIPLGMYKKIYFDYYFASFYLLLFIFIPATTYICTKTFFSVIFYAERRNHLLTKLKQIKNTNKKNMFKVAVGFFGFFLFFRILRNALEPLIFKTVNNQTIVILLSLLLFKYIAQFFKKNWRFVILSIALLLWYEFYRNINSPQMFVFDLRDIGFKTLLFLMFRSLLKNFIETYVNQKGDNKCFAHWIFLGVIFTWLMKVF